MNPQDAIDMGREAIRACFMVGGPVLLASLVIGLLVGVMQAMTQVQDQTVSFVPKFLCLMAVLGLCLPWLTDQLVDFGRQSWSRPMTHLNVSSSALSLRSSQPFSKTAAQPANDDRSPGLPPETKQLEEPEKDFRSPFLLPNYRFSRVPKSEIDG